MSKMVQDLKMEIEAIMKTKMEGTLEMEKPRNKNGNCRPKYHQQNTSDRRNMLK